MDNNSAQAYKGENNIDISSLSSGHNVACLEKGAMS